MQLEKTISKSGDIVFFDWEVDEFVNHFDIVEKVESGIIYTIEENSTNDTCRQKNQLGGTLIFEYGMPNY